MKVNFMIEKKIGWASAIKPEELLHLFRQISYNLDRMLKTKKQWYEQGFSRKQALENQVFCNTSFSEKTLLRWEKEYHKDYPYWGGGIWDGGSDDDSAAIECYTSYSSTGRRKNPLSLVINFYCDLSGANFNTDSLLEFLHFF